MQKHLLTAALAALLAAGAAEAGTAPLDVEALPHSTYTGANGVQASLVRFADQNWTEIDPATVLATKDSLFKEVCFEGKFESYADPVGIKLIGVEGNIVFEDKAKRKSAPEMKALDNVWVCGTLQPAKKGPGQEVLIYEVAKLPPDAQRFENKLLALEHVRNVPGLVELGQKIDQGIKSSRNGTGLGMQGFDRMAQLRDKAWTSAIAIKEKDMRPSDANACYEIALMYRELMHRTPLYRSWVIKALEIDPEHNGASKDAEHVFGLVKVGDKYISKSDYLRNQQEQETAAKELADKQKALERDRTARRTQEIAERTVRLLEYQAALRTSDSEARVGAITTLGDEVRKSLDLGFSLAAVDILTNMNDAAAIVPGMEKAAKSEFIEVRQLVYASLAWRASQNDVNSQVAYGVLASALRAEKMKEPAQAASAALVEAGGKGAVGTLIAGLDSTEAVVCEAMIDGLKKITHLQHQKKEEWLAWWNENKNQLPAKSFENAGTK